MAHSAVPQPERAPGRDIPDALALSPSLKPRPIPKNKIRFVRAVGLFAGNDAAINIMRRIIQSKGAEVIHLGHDRSVEDVVNTAIQEDAHAIAMTSYRVAHAAS